MKINYRLTLNPMNEKLKGITAATSNSVENSCPSVCALKEKGCYNGTGHLAYHRQLLAKNGLSEGEYIARLATLPRKQLNAKGDKIIPSIVRLRVDGDLPYDVINSKEIPSLDLSIKEAQALEGCKVIAFSHHNPQWLKFNAMVYRTYGHELNYSADNLDQVKEGLSLGLSVVTVADIGSKKAVTIDGVKFIRCPAEYKENFSCHNCGKGAPICSIKNRSFVVTFTPHGALKGSIKPAFDLSAKGVIDNSKGRFMAIRYRKKDGSITTLLARTGVKKHLKTGVKLQLQSVRIVWSADRKGYRSLILNSILSIKLAGVVYDFSL